MLADGSAILVDLSKKKQKGGLGGLMFNWIKKKIESSPSRTSRDQSV